MRSGNSRSRKPAATCTSVCPLRRTSTTHPTARPLTTQLSIRFRNALVVWSGARLAKRVSQAASEGTSAIIQVTGCQYSIIYSCKSFATGLPLAGGRPSPFQEEVWQAYLNGESGLIHAATGTGKTYAAWLGPVLEWLQRAASAKAPRLCACCGSRRCARWWPIPKTRCLNRFSICNIPWRLEAAYGRHQGRHSRPAEPNVFPRRW